jgi:hypothetical protein
VRVLWDQSQQTQRPSWVLLSTLSETSKGIGYKSPFRSVLGCTVLVRDSATYFKNIPGILWYVQACSKDTLCLHRWSFLEQDVFWGQDSVAVEKEVNTSPLDIKLPILADSAINKTQDYFTRGKRSGIYKKNMLSAMHFLRKPTSIMFYRLRNENARGEKWKEKSCWKNVQ